MAEKAATHTSLPRVLSDLGHSARPLHIEIAPSQLPALKKGFCVCIMITHPRFSCGEREATPPPPPPSRQTRWDVWCPGVSGRWRGRGRERREGGGEGVVVVVRTGCCNGARLHQIGVADHLGRPRHPGPQRPDGRRPKNAAKLQQTTLIAASFPRRTNFPIYLK